ncbi:D-erythronate dehydrogenase [Luteitalea sp.]
MTMLVTGGAGFLGTRLIQRLLAGTAHVPAAPRVICVDQVASPLADARVVSRVGSIADPAFVATAVDADVTAVWHLAAVLSGQSDAEPDLALTVNVGGTQALLEACRRLASPPRFVFASTIAVFGGPLPDVVPEDLALRPASTYGTTKAIAELLVLEATRRGVVDGLACRVPTVSVRPGQPNSAMSSFVSGIVREPLAGLESVCPVPLDTRLWVASPATTTANLAHAGVVGPEALGPVRTLNLPGVTLTPADLLDSLERAAGPTTRALVRLAPDAPISTVVGSWPGAFDVSRALALGFTIDRDADALVAQYLAERV